MATIKQVRKHILEQLVISNEGAQARAWTEALMNLLEVDRCEKLEKCRWQKDVNTDNDTTDK